MMFSRLKIILFISLLFCYELILAESTLTLPQQTTASNAAVKLEITKLQYFDSISGVKPLDSENQFLVLDVTLLNTISPELVFDHNIAEKLVFHHFAINGPFLQWGSEQVIGRIGPKRIKTDNHFPDPAYLNFEGDSLNGQFIFEVPRENIPKEVTLLWPDERFNLLTLDLFKTSKAQVIDSAQYDANGDFHLRVHNVDIKENGVALSLSGYRSKSSPTVTSTDGSALPLVNLSNSLLFVDGKAVKPILPMDTTAIVFVANRLLTHKLWYPLENLNTASNIGLVVAVKAPKSMASEPYWIFPLQGAPSIAAYISKGNKDPITNLDSSLENSNQNTDASATVNTNDKESVIIQPPFAPPWPEPPVVNALRDDVSKKIKKRLVKLGSEEFTNITPGVDHKDAMTLPMNQVVGTNFVDKQKYHVYLLEPQQENDQYTELLVWTKNPDKLKVQLYDLVEGNYGIVLANKTAKEPFSRLKIQKPTLLYLSKSKGELDYKILWHNSSKADPSYEHEPNSFRSNDPNLISILPRMLKVTENEYKLSGYLDTQDKIDYFVLESEEPGFVTLEASSGSVGIYIGNKDYKSKKIDKRIFLADILVLPGKNVFYIHGVKKDYTVKATISPIADRWHEMEPNDSPHLAHRLPIGQQRTGRLPIAKDYDYYFFDWPKKGPLRFSAKSGSGGDMSLWLYKDGKELMKFSAAETISKVVELEAGTYDLLAYTKKPSLEPYTLRLVAENPISVEKPNPDISISIVTDTNTVQPFSDKGQIINGVARIQNDGDSAFEYTLNAHSSHSRIFIDIPDPKVKVNANSSIEIPFQIRVRRLTYSVGKVPLFFTSSNDDIGVSTEWHLSFPYDASQTLKVWHDQPLPKVFMGAFDVARTDFGAVVHHDIVCNCSPKSTKSKVVVGTNIYRIRSEICPSALHNGSIGTDGGVIRVISTHGQEQYIGSTRNGIKSIEHKKSHASFQFKDTNDSNLTDVPECSKTLKVNHQGSMNLFNGLPFRSYFYGESMVVNLIGKEPILLSGIILSLRGTQKNQVQSFAIDISDNGETYKEELTSKLKLHDNAQPFVFDTPVSAAFVRIRLKSGFTDVKPANLRLGAMQVMAVKNKKLSINDDLNLASPALGAHVFSSSKGESIISFHHNRTALVNKITIESKESKLTTSIAVQTSEYGPYGPWIMVANEQLNPKSKVTVSLDDPIKVKFIRLSGNWSKNGKVFIKSVKEPSNDDTYQSILAEWGNQESDAYFELGVKPSPNVISSHIQSSAENPAILSVGDSIKSTVSLPLDLADFYRMEVPKNTFSIELKFSGDTQRTVVEITDKSGKHIPYTKKKSPSGQSAIFTVSSLLDIEEIFVKVFDKPKYLAILWDDSGSVSPYVSGFNRMLRNFAFDVDPRFEKINLMSFYPKNPKFLLDTWADSPFQLLSAIRSYIGTGSSSAYSNMEYALGKLDKVDGIKALLVMTDEQGDRGYYRNNKMENMISKSEAVIFSFHATSSKDLHNINANHMQTWSDIGGGRYTLIRSKDEVPNAIAKVQAWLRKPATYEMKVSALSNTPGTLKVTSKPTNNEKIPVIGAGAVEVILDASGSMWTRMSNGKARITVAKDVLLTLVSKNLPDNLPFALRVFGNRKAKSCRTDLEIPLGPLSREKTIKTIKAINPKNRSKTPIGDSLKAVTKDLKKSEGKNIIILITDGEETCDADPKKIISDLKVKGFDVQINIVGFAIDDEDLKKEFAEWASIGGGSYYDTNDAKQLIDSLQKTMIPKYTVKNSLGVTVASGQINDNSIDLLPGSYSVSLSVDGYKPKLITITPNKKTLVEF